MSLAINQAPRSYFFMLSTLLNMEFIMLINVKMPTNVEILTFIGMIDTQSASLKAKIL